MLTQHLAQLNYLDLVFPARLRLEEQLAVRTLVHIEHLGLTGGARLDTEHAMTVEMDHVEEGAAVLAGTLDGLHEAGEGGGAENLDVDT
jgi:hypothetical protein